MTSSFALVQALDDSITDVQLNAAKALASMGDTLHCVKVLARLVRGENKEQWTADWDGYMGLDSMSEDMIVRQKAQFRDGLQSKAIRLLRHLSTEEALSVLRSVGINTEEDRIDRYHRTAPIEVHEPAGKKWRERIGEGNDTEPG